MGVRLRRVPILPVMASCDRSHPAALSVRRLVAGLLCALAASLLAASFGAARSSAAAACGFHPVVWHRIQDRKHISCAEAKRVLRQLKGDRDTIPMVCGKARTIGGWYVENRGRQWSSVINRYSRGNRSFVYLREQNARRVYCPPAD